jgi:cytochrome c-type biogenesis protein
VTLEQVSGPLAFAAGLASFLSPCVLPLVPAYVAYLAGPVAQPVGAGPEQARRGRALAGAVAFIGGLAVVFVLFFYALRTVLFPYRAWLAPVAGVAVLLLALHTAGWLRLRILDRELRLSLRPPAGGGPVTGFVLGAGLALGWTPCVGPTLGAVLTSGSVEGTSAAGLVLLTAYCLGLGLPFLLLAVGLEEADAALGVLRRHRRALDLGAAAVLGAMGVLLLSTGNLVLLTQALSRVLPVSPPFGL